MLVSSILIHFKPSWKLADPLCTLIFGIFALISTLPTIWWFELMKNQYGKQPSSRKLLKTLLESTPENLCYDEVHETLSKVVRLKYQPTKPLNLLELDIGARGCWCSLATFVESFGSRGLSHCSPDHQGEELLLSLKLVKNSNSLKNLTSSLEKTWRGCGLELLLCSGPSTRSIN